MKKASLLSILFCSVLKASSPQLTSEFELFELWNSPTAWIREYVVSVSESLPNEEIVKSNLITSYRRLGKSLEPYYGTTKAQEFEKLVTEQAQLLIRLTEGLVEQDEDIVADTQTTLKEHSIILSSFLSKTNPYIPFNLVRNLLSDYLAAFSRMTKARMDQQWDKDAQEYKTVRTLSALLSQTFAQAMSNAFPLTRPASQKIPSTQPTQSLRPAFEKPVIEIF